MWDGSEEDFIFDYDQISENKQWSNKYIFEDEENNNTNTNGESSSVLADELLVSDENGESSSVLVFAGDENGESSSVLVDELLADNENEECSSILAGDDITEDNENIEYYERESLNYSNLWN